MTITAEQRAKLNADLPSDRIRSREQGGKTLSYVEAWDVIDTLNSILGAGAWGYQCDAHQEFCDRTEDDTRNGKVWRWHCTYTTRCVLTVDGCPPIADHGAGHGIDKDRGQAIESALKESDSDALKRCVKSLGRRVGLALYDKQQAHVGPPEPMPLGDKARQLITAINVAEDAQAKKNVMASIEAAWQSLRAHEQEAIEEAIEARKRKARGEL